MRAALGLALAVAAGGDGPQFSDTGLEAELYGRAAGYPVGTRQTFTQVGCLVGAFSHFDELFPSHRIARAESPSPWRRSPTTVPIEFDFRGEHHTLADYLARHPVTGLLVAQDDMILAEHYQYGRTDHDRLLSQSMGKSITALLVGLALADQSISSADDPVRDYVPELAGRAYGDASIGDLLHMSSGVEFREDYSGTDDDEQFEQALLFGPASTKPEQVVARFDTRVAPPGTRWNYAATEPYLLGLVLRNATGTSVAEYCTKQLWQPLGAEADAAWIVDVSGQELTHGFFCAVLRDYARLGRLLANDGQWNGRPLLPKEWLLAATTAPPSSYLAPGKLTKGLDLGKEPISAGPRSPDGRHTRIYFVAPPHRISPWIRLVGAPRSCGRDAPSDSVGPPETGSAARCSGSCRDRGGCSR